MHERSSVVVDVPRICLVPKMTDLPSLVNIKGSPEISSVAPGPMRWLVRGATALALVVAASWLGYAVAFQRGIAGRAEQPKDAGRRLEQGRKVFKS